MKIFNLSLQRVGTQSFHSFVSEKIKSMHFVPKEFDIPDNENDLWEAYNQEFIMQDYTAFSDFPIPLFAEKIFEYYPDSCFICFDRPDQEWAASVMRLFESHIRLEENCIVDNLFYQKYCGVNDIKNINQSKLIEAKHNYYKLLNEHKEKITFISLNDSSEEILSVLNELTELNFTSLYPTVDFLKQ